MAHGKTLLMRNIPGPKRIWVHRHRYPTMAMKKAGVPIKVRGKKLPIPANLIRGVNKPYYKPLPEDGDE